jgi:hypothetical protein
MAPAVIAGAGGNTRCKIVVVPGVATASSGRRGSAPRNSKAILRIAPEFFEALAAWDPFI